MNEIIPLENVEKNIFIIRGQKIMFDRDLAELYGVETKALIQAVKRNLSRFPSDFMFQLNNQEVVRLRSQIVTSKSGRGGRRYLPYVFTELTLTEKIILTIKLILYIIIYWSLGELAYGYLSKRLRLYCNSLS